MSVYQVTITGNYGSAPNDGFIDPTTVYAYVNLGDGLPTDYPTSVAKSRANRRHKWVVLGVMGNSSLQIVEFNATGSPNCNTAPTTMVYQASSETIPATLDENNAGVTLTGVAAVTRFFARCLIRSETLILEALDPTQGVVPGNSTPYARTGPRFEIQTVGPVFASLAAAEAAITTTVIG